MKPKVPLYQIAHARSGDKFDTSLISVFPYNPNDLAWLQNQLTTSVVGNYFKGIIHGKVERRKTPYGLIFELDGALEGGVAAGLRRDKHGKSLSGYMLEIKIDQER